MLLDVFWAIWVGVAIGTPLVFGLLAIRDARANRIDAPWYDMTWGVAYKDPPER